MPQPAPARPDGTVFDEVAAEYDRSRPAYPGELVDRACEVAGLGRGASVLEVGCGSGQLTGSLVDRGLRVTAVEPGTRLMSLAERQLADRGEIEFVNARFEDADLDGARYQAVFCASAFHWIDAEVSWPKAARLLAPGGTLALIQYCGLLDPADDQRAVVAVLARVAPEIAAGLPAYRELASIVAGVQQRRANVSDAWAWIGSYDIGSADAARLFCDVRLATVPVAVEHTAAELTRVLRTMSFYSRLSADRRRALEHEHAALGRRLGRPFRSSTVAVLVTARRR